MADWQPIETALKECGLPDIIVSDGRFVTVANWDDEDETWRDQINSDGYEGLPIRPTHWMPLPAPPKGEK